MGVAMTEFTILYEDGEALVIDKPGACRSTGRARAASRLRTTSTG
jgi:23S rRNA-/tRNA-specific pseudouridylate synthase